MRAIKAECTAYCRVFLCFCHKVTYYFFEGTYIVGCLFLLYLEAEACRLAKAGYWRRGNDHHVSLFNASLCNTFLQYTYDVRYLLIGIGPFIPWLQLAKDRTTVRLG